MITQMEVFTPGIDTPPFPVVDQLASLDSIQIKKIDGLGPVTATINSTAYGSIDGETFDGSFTPKRNIVITAALNPDYSQGQTYEGIRQALYSYFMTENQVTLRFTSTHLATVEITGYVESCEPDMFAKDPEYQISIICPQPYFTAVSATTVTGTTQAIAGGPTDFLLNYEGNADVGFVIDVNFPAGGMPDDPDPGAPATSYTGEFRVVNSTPTLKLSIVSPITVSTTTFFRLSSVQGNKFARNFTIGSPIATNVLGKFTPGSSWLTLRKGVNHLQVLSADAGLKWNLSYFAKYGGL